MKGALILWLCLFAATAAADEAVYRDSDAKGVAHYTDRAPDRHARPIHLAPLSGPRPTQRSQTFYSPEALREAARFSVRVESPTPGERLRSEEHTSELQSLMRISYAVFCLKKKKQDTKTTQDKHTLQDHHT